VPAPKASVSVHTVLASVELQPVDVGVRFAVMVCVALPVIATVMLCVEGEMYAGRRLALVLVIVGIAIANFSVPSPLAFPEVCALGTADPPLQLVVQKVTNSNIVITQRQREFRAGRRILAIFC